jgi:hypothetical protein
LSAVSLGIVGDSNHRTGYHLGADRTYAGDYSTLVARDRAGLTNAASALDIGNHPELRQLSRWLVDRARHNAPGTADIREIIYSPDGVVVLRWDRERGYGSLPQPSTASKSHTTHSHVSRYRDSERRDKIAVFAPFYAELPDTSTGDEMPGVRAEPVGKTVGGIFRALRAGDAIPIIGGTRTPIAAGAIRHVVGPYQILAFADPTRLFYIGTEDDAPAFIAATLGTFQPYAAAGTPDCTDAIAIDRARARIVYD